MTVSIVMTAYKRAGLLKNTLESIHRQTRQPDQIIIVEDGHDGGATQGVAVEFQNRRLPVEYYRRHNRPNLGYSNPAIPKNIGIKKATGDILIIQCAEVMFTEPTDLENLVRPVEQDETVSSFALVKALHANGDFHQWYAGPERAPKWYLDFCQAVCRQAVLNIGGFDEKFEGYGFDDDNFALRLQASGIKYQWANDVICHHQYHEIIDKDTHLSEAGRQRFDRIKFGIETGKGGLIANEGCNWGDPQS
jgi:GT2 family glycosyltransferase